ncbi:ABC transporter ATP-binding protein [Desulfosarcina ovata]|uniref:Sugar ABC transporter ATP-binding protein n=1 Tax=Desulfosarcina ovata subsp. ovata TaxID=2752305 RepID=A0A5K8AF11_9BACT|nr:ABC transporter ATP-binding protein [Desulfosarcina ovata]BBO91235.1 sugar ABC transporter ATP-binding protein [Desulfosarcina ovata subsp. ovata]
MMEKQQPALKKNQAILEVQALSKSFHGTTALDRASFTVPEASLTVILGPAGAGKTTTLRLIAGLDRPDNGRVLLAGRDVGKWEPKDRNIAMIFDTLALYPNKTGYENIASPLKIRRLPKDEIEVRVIEMARTLKVSRLLDRLPKTMSGGERQRIALGRALIRTPTLFLLDEPLSSLDAMLRIELRAELKRLQRELGYTFLMATPDFNEALAVADTVIMLHSGRVVQISRPQELYDQPLDRDIASFVGAPQINLIDARYEPNASGGVMHAAAAGLPVPAHLKQALGDAPCDFVLGIRPENLKLTALEDAPISASLVDIEPLGLKSVLTVQNNAAQLRLHVESAMVRRFDAGRPLGIEPVNPTRLLAFDRQSGQLLNA